MSTDTLDDIREETTTTPYEPGDHDRFAHYVHKDDIIRATFDGAAVFALCGKLWVANRNPEGLTVCPDCKAAYERKNPPRGDDS